MLHKIKKWERILRTSTTQLNSLPKVSASQKDIETLTAYYKQRIKFAKGRIEALEFFYKTTPFKRTSTHKINVVDAVIL
tara:strand:+ start:1541 stop:1777 length:237 start_codon:yes stop_codon:yes gene_type:complete